MALRVAEALRRRRGVGDKFYTCRQWFVIKYTIVELNRKRENHG